MPDDGTEPQNDHPWDGFLIDSQFTPCLICGRSLAAHSRNDCPECGHPTTAHQAAVTRSPGPCSVCGCRAIEPQNESLDIKALRWAAWSWGNPHAPEPPCPTDDEFDTIAERFGYRIDRGYDDEN